MKSIVQKLIKNQNKKKQKPNFIKNTDKIGFAFSTKDRPDFTKQTLNTIDIEKGFDLIWCDGSDAKEGKKLLDKYKFKNIKLAEKNWDVHGGPDKAICFGLKRLLDLGYDYCGLIENDILFKKGWFKKLIDSYNFGVKEGLAVGATTIRNYESRVLEYRNNYTINWNIGAGMILFSRQAAKIIVNNYPSSPITARKIRLFYAKLTGIDLIKNKELWFNKIDRRLSPDWEYETILYKHGLTSVGSVPAFIEKELEAGVSPEERNTRFVNNKKITFTPYPKISKIKIFLIEFTNQFFSLSWLLFKKSPKFYKFIK